MHSRHLWTAAATATLVVVLTGCGEGATPMNDAAPGSTSSATGRLAYFGALPNDRSSGALVLDLATGRQVRMGDQQEAWSVAWAGADRLAVVRGHARISGDGPGELVLVAADGSDEGTPIGGVADVREVASSADGQHLAFLGRTETSSNACSDPAATERMGLYVAAVDGSGARRVVDVPTASRFLALSPDGRTAAVVDMGDDTVIPQGRDWCNPGESRLVLIDTATGVTRVVAGATAMPGAPRFSPDGNTVVLDGSDSGYPDRDVVLVDVASAQATRLSTPDVVEANPVFSPDGRSLAVLRHRAGQDPGATATIAVGAADGSGLRDVATTGTEDYGLAWMSDGSHLVVAGAVVTMACDDDDGRDGGVVGLAAPAGGCDVATATTDLRVVPASGGELRQVSDTVTGFDAGLAAAPLV
ncbi:component of the Tol biopolymer transport system [Quadrisphaera granulorum]|uniref:Tol biopolymer transport system component n=1 Tax=Quadrisphaera granulorum TaxID=317664 RepID=A0A316AXL3_9ACTN|nr:PD40 domain-containing protein [Quadrisphaera granulorum]PWJ54947.1 Tol biopolymer transport system component [Quadrisphaera granulorum]SZE95893.1 component of the Tol biopolymer transport system [Quadrisphaera granulorum]